MSDEQKIKSELRNLIATIKVAREEDTGNYEFDNGFACAANFVIRELERISQ